jgi:hypothetical protein
MSSESKSEVLMRLLAGALALFVLVPLLALAGREAKAVVGGAQFPETRNAYERCMDGQPSYKHLRCLQMLCIERGGLPQPPDWGRDSCVFPPVPCSVDIPSHGTAGGEVAPPVNVMVPGRAVDPPAEGHNAQTP